MSANGGEKPLIYFGVNGMGMGHATRSLPLLRGLEAHFRLKVFCSRRVKTYLEEHGFTVYDVWQPTLYYEHNRLRSVVSTLGIIVEAPGAIRQAMALARQMDIDQPVAVVSDYDPVTAWAGMFGGRKIISFDNQHVVTWGDYPLPPGIGISLSKRLIAFSNFSILPVKHRVLLSSFYRPPLLPGAQERGVRYVPVVARPMVKERVGRTRTDGPVLVYQTSETNVSLLETLGKSHVATGLSFVVYGAKVPSVLPSGVVCKRFSEEGFLDDMSAAPFVLLNGGHSTICEALTLGKPILAEPIIHQFEQTTNVIGLEQMGVGRGTSKLTVQDIERFVQALPQMRAAVQQVPPFCDTEQAVQVLCECIQTLTP